ncbi:MAG: HEPN domain-containing protein [Thermodesulfobacteriota bacterium]
MSQRTKDWLQQAERDLEAAKWSLKGRFYEWSCFSCQQAAEKALKALYQHLNLDAWGHSVSKLMADLPQKAHPPKSLIEKAIYLDRFYIPTRYPNDLPSGAPMSYFTERDAKEAIKYCGEIIRYCKDKIT